VATRGKRLPKEEQEIPVARKLLSFAGRLLVFSVMCVITGIAILFHLWVKYINYVPTNDPNVLVLGVDPIILRLGIGLALSFIGWVGLGLSTICSLTVLSILLYKVTGSRRRLAKTQGLWALWAFGIAVASSAVLVTCYVTFRFLESLEAPLQPPIELSGSDIGIYILVAIGVIWFLLLIRIGYRYRWTGFGETPVKKPEGIEVLPKKTLWDWLQLLGVLAIPVVIASKLSRLNVPKMTARLRSSVLKTLLCKHILIR
jgi:hypothetical protein